MSTIDAMTDPNPRVTKRIGNAQQTSVVSTVVSPTIALARSARMSSLQPDGPAVDCESSTMRESDAERWSEQHRRAVELPGDDGAVVAAGRLEEGDRIERRNGQRDCVSAGRGGSNRGGADGLPSLFVRRAARISGRLIVTVPVVGPLTALAPIGRRKLPARARHRRRSSARQNQHE